MVGIRLGLAVRQASIRPTKGARGQVIHLKSSGKSSNNASLGRLINEGVMLYAGSLAEARHTGYVHHEGAGRIEGLFGRAVAPGTDYDHVGVIVVQLTRDGREQDALARWLRRRAEVWVENEWRRIERVAEALLERETLTRRAIVSLMRAA